MSVSTTSSPHSNLPLPRRVTEIPPIPKDLGPWHLVDRYGEGVPPYVAYILYRVKFGIAGGIGYDWATDSFLLYYPVTDVDVRLCPTLNGIAEVWLGVEGEADGS